MNRKTLQITKGRDPYLDMTALSDYCRQHGWQILSEVVTIRMPEGRELEDLQKDLQGGKIRVVEPRKEK